MKYLPYGMMFFFLMSIFLLPVPVVPAADSNPKPESSTTKTLATGTLTGTVTDIRGINTSLRISMVFNGNFLSISRRIKLARLCQEGSQLPKSKPMVMPKK